MRAKPKKRLGQNFLIDANIRRKVISACNFNPDDIVLEIGAGRGELSGLIAERVSSFYAVEIDQELLPILEGNLKTHRNVELINRDILKFDLKKFSAGFKKRLKIIGNIPYYISTPIIEHIFQARSNIGDVYLTVQKEFAQRMAAAPGSKQYGSLSCFAQYHASCKALFVIRKNSFYPAPKVDSAFINLKIKTESSLAQGEERRLFRIIRSAFNQRRKTLRNSLKGVVSQKRLGVFFRQTGINPNVRPESISLEQFIILAKSDWLQARIA